MGGENRERGKGKAYSEVDEFVCIASLHGRGSGKAREGKSAFVCIYVCLDGYWGGHTILC